MKKIFLCLLPIIFAACAKGETIAEVNGKKISLNYLERELEKLPESLRKNFDNDYPGFLEELITIEILSQEAKRLKIDTIIEVKAKIAHDKNMRNNILATELLNREVVMKIQVSEDELKKFYSEHKKETKGSTYEHARPQIYQILRDQKKQDALNAYIADLRDRARVIRNKKWLERKLTELDDPIDETF